MFGWRRRRSRRDKTEAPASNAEAAPTAPPVEAESESAPPAENSKPDRRERPIVDLLTDGERLGFEPELHTPADED